MRQAGESEMREARAFVLGFACNQGFLFSLFYLGSNRAVGEYPFLFERAELFGTLLFLAMSLVFLRIVSAPVRNALISRPLSWLYATLLVAGSLFSVFVDGATGVGLLAECLLVGVSLGFALASWGRILGCWPIDKSVPTVFIASALGGAVCFICVCMPVSQAIYALHFLPFGSAAAMSFLLSKMPKSPLPENGAEEGDSAPGRLGQTRSESEGAARGSASPEGGLFASLRRWTSEPLFAAEGSSRISSKITAGTAVFGVAAGFMETYGSDPGMATTPTFRVTLFLFVLFCLAALQLFEGEESVSGARAEKGRMPFLRRVLDGGRALSEQGPLDNAYRLAFLLMMGGFLFVPVLSDFNVPGEAIMLAGYLGLMAVLVSLFLIMGRIAEQDTALSFARGFTALFLGEMAGIALGNFIEMGNGETSTPYVVVACAGLAMLYAYLFLFTENDFRALSVAVRETDRFEEVCTRLVSECGLTKREADILPFALKGRTNERIALELCVAKSTVDTHLRHIYAKCAVHSRQELIDLGESLQRLP